MVKAKTFSSPRTRQAPRYLHLVNELRRQVESGALAAGEKLPSYSEMRAQGYGQNVMDRAYALLQSEGLIVREHGRGVFVAPTALRNVAEASAAKTLELGLVVFDAPHEETLQESLYGLNLHGQMIQRGVQHAARQVKAKLTLLDLRSPVGWGEMDGVLAMWDVEPKLVRRLARKNTPCVWLMDPHEGQSSVIADERGGAQLLTEHLLKLGHRRIACLTTDHWQSQRRLQGYHQALREAGIEADPRWVRDLHFPHRWDSRLNFAGHARQTVETWLQGDWTELDCTALLAQNDQAAFGAIEGFRRAGMDVPADISVCGFDDTAAALYLLPHLTTIGVPLFEMGRQSVELLITQIENQTSSPVSLTLPTRLMVRDSTAAPKQTNPFRKQKAGSPKKDV